MKYADISFSAFHGLLSLHQRALPLSQKKPEALSEILRARHKEASLRRNQSLFRALLSCMSRSRTPLQLRLRDMALTIFITAVILVIFITIVILSFHHWLSWNWGCRVQNSDGRSVRAIVQTWLIFTAASHIAGNCIVYCDRTVSSSVWVLEVAVSKAEVVSDSCLEKCYAKSLWFFLVSFAK